MIDEDHQDAARLLTRAAQLSADGFVYVIPLALRELGIRAQTPAHLIALTALTAVGARGVDGLRDQRLLCAAADRVEELGEGGTRSRRSPRRDAKRG